MKNQGNKQKKESVIQRFRRLEKVRKNGLFSESEQAEWDILKVELEEETKRLLEQFNQLRNKTRNGITPTHENRG